MKKNAVAIILIVIFTVFVFGVKAEAGTPIADFNVANDYYSRGNYTEAIRLYESLTKEGHINATLYYNLANAYYKAGQSGKTILNYERAQRLSPRDGDIRSNLAFVLQQIKEPAPSFIVSVLSRLDYLLSLDELTVIWLICFILLFCGAALFLFMRNQWLMLFIGAMVILSIVSGSWLLLKFDAQVWTRHAVVTTGPADVRNGPGVENSVGFTLPEGREIVILGGKDDWAAVGLPSEGLRGWVEKKYIEEL